MIETKDQVEQFLLLQKKKVPELRAICEGMKLDTKGKKAELIDRLTRSGDNQFQRNPTRPQAIPLRTRGPNGQPLPQATDVLKGWRKTIFNGQNNLRSFGLVNSRGKSYTQELRYAKCSEGALKVILGSHWFMAHMSQRDLIGLLKTKSEKFDLSIIQKPDSSGNSWLMLHVCPKEK